MIRTVHPIKKSPCCKSQQPKPSIFRERSHSTEAEESSLQGEPSPLMQCSLMDLPGRAPLQPKVAGVEQQVNGIAEKPASPVIQRYVRVGLYEGSFGLDHIGVGVNSEKTLGFSPKEGLGREAEKGSWVDGEVKEDHGLLDSLTIRTNPRQEARLEAALNRAESSPQKFNLHQHNCSQHGAEILKSAGLNAKSSPIPRAFFEGLKRQYASGQKEAAGDGGPLQGKFTSNASAAAETGTRPNRTGMPDRLKSGIESLSGMDMSDVRVHPNSELPAQMDALAYTQGNQIYLGPGEERHLPHEAWHVVQQKQGRVRATRQMKGVGVNDDLGLEGEAGVMGAKAGQYVSATDEEMLQRKLGRRGVERASRNMGLLNNIGAGIESLSGIGMDRVKVHNSSGKVQPGIIKEHETEEDPIVGHWVDSQQRKSEHLRLHMAEQPVTKRSVDMQQVRRVQSTQNMAHSHEGVHQLVSEKAGKEASMNTLFEMVFKDKEKILRAITRNLDIPDLIRLSQTSKKFHNHVMNEPLELPTTGESLPTMGDLRTATRVGLKGVETKEMRSIVTNPKTWLDKRKSQVEKSGQLGSGMYSTIGTSDQAMTTARNYAAQSGQVFLVFLKENKRCEPPFKKLTLNGLPEGQYFWEDGQPYNMTPVPKEKESDEQKSGADLIYAPIGEGGRRRRGPFSEYTAYPREPFKPEGQGIEDQACITTGAIESGRAEVILVPIDEKKRPERFAQTRISEKGRLEEERLQEIEKQRNKGMTQEEIDEVEMWQRFYNR